MVLGFGQMLPDDQPERDLWLDDEALLAHFEAVRAKHAKPGDEAGDEDYVENAAAKALLKQIG